MVSKAAGDFIPRQAHSNVMLHIVIWSRKGITEKEEREGGDEEGDGGR